MKRILYIAIMATLLVVSCQKTDILNVVEDTIEFSTEVGKLTKTETTAPNYAEEKYETLVNQGFRVWAISDFTIGNDSKGQVYRGLKNLPVEHGTTGWGFAPSVTNKYLWPQGGYYLYFYAVSSDKDATWLSDGDTEAITTLFKNDGTGSVKGVTFPVYTVDPTAHDDVMVADHIYQTKSMSRTVKPNFRHTMTKVVFNFKKGGPQDNGAEEASNIILKSISTTALTNKGKLSVTYSTPEVKNDETTIPAKEMTFEWEEQSSTSTFSKNADGYVTYVKAGGEIITSVESFEALPSGAEDGARYVVYSTTDTGVSASVYKSQNGAWAVDTTTEYITVQGKALTDTFVPFVTWYMIPQDLDEAKLLEGKELSGAVVTINYIADGKPLSQNFALTVSTTEAGKKDWNEESCVKYNVTIAPHKIVFKPSVDSWTEQGTDMDN